MKDWRPQDEVPSGMTPDEREAFWEWVVRENTEALFRPQDEFDVDVPPESTRGVALSLMDKMAEIERALRAEIGDAMYDELMALAVGHK